MKKHLTIVAAALALLGFASCESASNLKYTCYAGVFRSYAAALRQLNKVRALGFTEARIVVWQDGKSADVSALRAAGE